MSKVVYSTPERACLVVSPDYQWDSKPSRDSLSVFEADDQPVFTGVLTPDGKKIYRRLVRDAIGFPLTR